MMEKQIKRMGIVLTLLFLVLFVQLNNLQWFQAAKLSSSVQNPRVAIRMYDQARGTIQIANGQIIAQSVPSHDKYKFQRVYPNGPLYADITGYFSLVYGNWGIESSYNKYLISHTHAITNINQLITSNNGPDDVTLTINAALQSQAQQSLGSKIGAVVALNPRNGDILAMYSSPSYDPNLLASHNVNEVVSQWKSYLSNPTKPMLNRAIQRSYFPGSTFKIVTASAVYDHDPKLATKSFPYYTDIPLPNSNRHLANYDHELCGGKLPLLMQVSCDTGFGLIGLALGASNLVTEAQAFGFNKVPPIDIPGAAMSTIPSIASFASNLPGVAYSAIGQENVQATALSMALAVSAIADGGTIMKPHLMSEITDSQGNLVTEYKPTPWLDATSPATAAAVTSLLVGVVNGGTASNIAIPGLEIAAKTGTAQTAVNGALNNWMEAFAPAQNPSLVVVAVVPAQPGLPAQSTGSAQAGPIVKSMFETAIQQKLLP